MKKKAVYQITLFRTNWIRKNAMTPEKAVRELGRHLQLHDLSLGENKSTRIVVNDKIPISLCASQDDSALHIYYNFGPLLYDKSLRITIALLKANHYTHQTLGATFSLSPLKQDVILSRTLELDILETYVLIEIFNRFIEAVEYWQKSY